MGILPQVSQTLGVSIPTAGLLVSGYALGVAVGAPILVMLTRHASRKNTLLMLMLIFTLGNVLCALSYSYSMMMIARIVTSFAHGAFFGIGAIVATRVVAPEKKASAIALMFLGLTLANVVGVPFGTWVAHYANWHLTFWLISGIGVLSLLAIFFFIPSCGKPEPVDFMKELSILKQKSLRTALYTTVFSFASVFAIFTYISPLLTEVSGLPLHFVSLVLLMIGVGATIGKSKHIKGAIA